jgi:hypothetical protein
MHVRLSRCLAHVDDSALTATCSPNIDSGVARGHALHQINGQVVPYSYGAIVTPELAHLCEFPAVRVDVCCRCLQRPAPAITAA